MEHGVIFLLWKRPILHEDGTIILSLLRDLPTIGPVKCMPRED